MGKRTLLIFIHALKTTVVRIMLIHWINQWNIWACIAYSVNFKLQINWSIDWLIDWLIDYLIDRLHVYIRNNYQKISLISYYLNFTGFHLKFPFIRKIISNILNKKSLPGNKISKIVQLVEKQSLSEISSKPLDKIKEAAVVKVCPQIEKTLEQTHNTLFSWRVNSS